MKHTTQHLTGSLTGVASSFNKWADTLDRVINEAHDHSIVDVAVLLFKVKEAYSEMDAARKSLYKKLDHLSKSVVPEMMDEVGVDRIQIPEIGYSVGPLTKMSASMVNKKDAMDWLTNQGASDLITTTVNAASLASFVREYIAETGAEPPADAIKVNPYRISSFNRYTVRD